MLYIRLFHGRTDSAQEMDDWGSDGPVFGPCNFIHTTYSSLVRLGNEDGSCGELFLHEDILYYDGCYYGDWSVFDETAYREGDYQTTAIEESKANLPES